MSEEQERFASIGRVASQVAHDLKTPLANLRMALSLLDDREPEERRALVLRMEAEIDRCGRMIDDFMDLTRAASLQRAPARIGPLVRHAWRALRPPETLELELEVDDLPPLRLDADRMARVFEHLLRNAAEAVEGAGVVRVAGRAVGSEVEVRVEDSGPGVPDADREVALQAGWTTRPGHPGLGLAICRRHLEDHGGRIALEEAPGGGACAVVRLPLEG